jgi:16S rRNA (uracil1498-N3)-methyltransferase
MGHIPHLLLPRPWEAERIDVSGEQRHHLEKVLRVSDGTPIEYTDGSGSIGRGSYHSGGVARGEESTAPRPSDLTVVAAPPDNRDRARFMVEKLAELGVAELRFLGTRHGQGRPPRIDRVRSWAVSGLEQSRGAWLMKLPEGVVALASLDGPLVVCDASASTDRPKARIVVIGPEGGWAPGEVPDDAERWSLGNTVLRVETAAIVAAARLL